MSKSKRAKMSSPKNGNTKTTKVEVATPTVVEKVRKPSITRAIYSLFEEKGADNVTVAEAIEVAKKLKPDTKFSKWHLYFHRCEFKKLPKAVTS